MPVRARRRVVLPWSMWPAVPTTTVTRRSSPSRQRARDCVGERHVVAGLDGPQVEDAPRPSSMRPTTGGAPAGAAPAARPARRPDARRRTTAASGPAASRRRRSPRCRRHARRRGRPPRRSPSARASRSATRRARSWRHTGISRARRRPARYSPSVAATAASITLSGRIARASGSLRSRATRSARPTTNPGLRAADQLVAAERHEVGAGGEALRGHRLVREPEGRGVEERPAAEVVDDDRAVPVGGRGQRRRVGRLHEPGLAEVRRVDAEDEPGAAVGEGRLEVGDARPVRRPDLDQPRACPPDDLRDPDAAADLDELAARPTATPPRPARPTASATAAALLFDDQRVLGAGQRDEVRPRRRGTAGHGGPVSRSSSRKIVPRPRPAAASIAAARPRRPAEVGVHDHAGRVDRPAGAGAPLEGRRGGRRSAAARSSEVGRGWRRPARRRARSSSTTARAIASTRRRGRDRRSPRGRPRARVRRSAVARRAARQARSSHAVHGGGGSAWESNPPRDAGRRATGFEDRGTHRDPSAPAARW